MNVGSTHSEYKKRYSDINCLSPSDSQDAGNKLCNSPYCSLRCLGTPFGLPSSGKEAFHHDQGRSGSLFGLYRIRTDHCRIDHLAFELLPWIISKDSGIRTLHFYNYPHLALIAILRYHYRRQETSTSVA